MDAAAYAAERAIPPPVPSALSQVADLKTAVSRIAAAQARIEAKQELQDMTLRRLVAYGEGNAENLIRLLALLTSPRSTFITEYPVEPTEIENFG